MSGLQRSLRERYLPRTCRGKKFQDYLRRARRKSATLLISLSEEISLLSRSLPQDAAQTSRRRRQNPFVLRQTFFTAFAAAGDRLNLPNSRTSEVTYGLVSLMELAAHCGARHWLPPNGSPDLKSTVGSEFRPRQGLPVGKTLERRICGSWRSPESPKLQKIGGHLWIGTPYGTRCALRRSPRSLFSLPAFLPPIISQSFRAWSKVCSMCF